MKELSYQQSRRECGKRSLARALSAFPNDSPETDERPVSCDALGLASHEIMCAGRVDAMRNRRGFADHLICVPPLIVVPAHDFEQITVNDLGELEIDH